MTMQPTWTYNGDYSADRETLARDVGVLASQFGLDAIGREYPRRINRRDGHSYAKAGKWYAEVAGERRALTAKEHAALRRISMGALSTYGAERFPAA